MARHIPSIGDVEDIIGPHGHIDKVVGRDRQRRVYHFGELHEQQHAKTPQTASDLASRVRAEIARMTGLLHQESGVDLYLQELPDEAVSRNTSVPRSMTDKARRAVEDQPIEELKEAWPGLRVHRLIGAAYDAIEHYGIDDAPLRDKTLKHHSEAEVRTDRNKGTLLERLKILGKNIWTPVSNEAHVDDLRRLSEYYGQLRSKAMIQNTAKQVSEYDRPVQGVAVVGHGHMDEIQDYVESDRATIEHKPRFAWKQPTIDEPLGLEERGIGYVFIESDELHRNPNPLHR